MSLSGPVRSLTPSSELLQKLNRFFSTLTGMSSKAKRSASVRADTGRCSGHQGSFGAGESVPPNHQAVLMPCKAATQKEATEHGAVKDVKSYGYDGFRWLSGDEVSNLVRTSLEQQFESLPRPPRSFHELLSLHFVARASSNYLGELVAAEPIVVARILARVNSSLYGTRAPIERLGQAITFLGLHSVRNICLRYLLNESFKLANSSVKKTLNRISEASSIATDLAERVARRLELEDPASLTTQVVLSFTGHLACALIEPSTSNSEAPTGLLQRFEQQQASIGLAAPEVGRLLLISWGLPKQLINKVAAIDRVLLPLEGPPSPTSQSAAVAFLCARLGEHLANDGPNKPGDFEAWLKSDNDLRFLASHFGQAYYVGVVQTISAPDFLEGIRAAVKPQD